MVYSLSAWKLEYIKSIDSKIDLYFISAAFPFYCMHRKGYHTVGPKIEWQQGVYDPGAFKLDHLHHLKPLLFWKFFDLFHFHTGRPILITPEANNGKREFSQPPKWMRGFSVLGAFNLDHLHHFKPFLFRKFSIFLSFILGGQFLQGISKRLFLGCVNIGWKLCFLACWRLTKRNVFTQFHIT